MNILLKLTSSLPAFGWLLLSIAGYTCGEYFSKLWGNHPAFSYGLCALFGYTVGSVLWLFVMLQRNQLALMTFAWLALSIISSLIVALFVFHEKLNAYQWTGAGLAMVALGFLLIGE